MQQATKNQLEDYVLVKVQDAVKRGIKAGDEVLIKCHVDKIEADELLLRMRQFGATIWLSGERDIYMLPKPKINFAKAGLRLKNKITGNVYVTTGKMTHGDFYGFYGYMPTTGFAGAIYINTIDEWVDISLLE